MLWVILSSFKEAEPVLVFFSSKVNIPEKNRLLALFDKVTRATLSFRRLLYKALFNYVLNRKSGKDIFSSSSGIFFMCFFLCVKLPRF